MREMKDSGVEWIGEIPKNWKICRLKDYAHICNGRDYSEVLDENGDYPVIGSGGQFAKACEPLYQKESVLLGRKGTIDKPLFVDYPFWTVDTMYYTEIKENASAKYFYYLCTQIEFDFYQYGSAVPSMTQRDLYNVNFPYPTLDEQRRIADYLERKCSQIDAIIVRQQEVIEKLKAYKLSVITEAVTKGLNPDVPMKDSGIPWVGNICNHYALSRVGAFCFVTKLAGFEYTDIMSSAISDTGEVPIVRAQNVRMFNFNDNIDEYIGLDVSQKLYRCALNKKCLLITFIGAGIGDVCVFSKTMRYHLAPNVAKIEIRDEYKTILDEEYLMFYLGSLAGKGEISKISKASAQPSLSMGTIRGITIAVPPIDEQREISEYLSKKIAFIDKVVRDKESIIENLLAYKSSLIYEVVTGKKEV